ncbi:uncharacterized protein MEPE_02363 [Melanopsichium pennsylvanicum]|uniref:Uncharacterized protein n=2 Tax=Melanopsichium pennsylvanicum TaxID=63383 RepID=A0AAJ5C4G3_9BASI|nr:uncharacterized protein MEPE_02363 [Melanopsichium pennsylvanicum]
MTQTLPAELVARIIAFLVPPVDRNASTLPHPTGPNLAYTPALPSPTNQSLLSVASCSTLLHRIANQALHRTVLLRSLKSLNLLAGTIAADTNQLSHTLQKEQRHVEDRAAWIRSIHLPPGDGLLQPGDTLADQTCYIESLRILLDHASRLDFICLEHRQAGAALLEFLHPSTACRPRRITLSNLSFSAPPFSATRSLAPLSKLTHLHLIKIVPPPALISFLVGESINSDEQGNVPKSLEAGLSPGETLECLRLSLLPPDALVDFGAYIAWRKAWKKYEQLTTQEQAQEYAPRAPRGPARRFAVQEALYDLAVYSSRLPRLRLLLLELSPLGPLPPPVNGPFADFLRSRGIPRVLPVALPGPSPASSRGDRNASMSQKALCADVRAKRSDANNFFDAIRSSRSAEDRTSYAASSSGPQTVQYYFGDDAGLHDTNGGVNDEDDDDAPPSTAEDLRTAERDKYWRLVEAGKGALVELWAASQQLSNNAAGCGAPDIRVVTARPMGHDRREGFQDFYCQAQNEPPGSTSTELSANSRENGSMVRDHEASEEVGCWADPDVFSLISTAPWLSYTSQVGESYHWTGELPRKTNYPTSLVIPSMIFLT